MTTRTRSIGAVAIIGSLAGLAMCGSETDPPTAPSVGAPEGTETRVTGSERLGWMQPAESLAQARSYTYAAYINDRRVPLTDVNCEGGVAAGLFDCLAPLPKLEAGRRVLVLVAIDSRGVEGERAQPIVLLVEP